MKKTARADLRGSLAGLTLGLAASVLAAAAEFQVTSIMPNTNGITITWTNPVPENAYTLQIRDSLTGGTWTNAPTRYGWPSVATHWTEPGVPAAASRFYRVMAEPIRQPQRGRLLAVKPLQALTALMVRGILANEGFGTVTSAQWPVRVVSIDYETVDPYGLPIIASGACFFPQGNTNALPLLSYHHGTIMLKDHVASKGLNPPDTEPYISGYEYTDCEPSLLFAASGYAVAMPDYLGMGDSPGYHPYQHAKTEATAAVDMLRAVRTFCSTNGVSLNTQLFLCGYSQGGSVTVATHREIETYCTNEFTITASAPMAGGYDLSGVTTDYLLTNHYYPAPWVFAYLLAAYLPIYHLADTLEELLAPPYNRTLPALLDGGHAEWEIKPLPSDAVTILRADYLAALRNDPNHPLRLALRENDLYRWTPRAPIHLYYCAGDIDVPPANALVAYQSFTNSGACCVSLIDPGYPQKLDHQSGYVPSVLAAKQWFDSLKQ